MTLFITILCVCYILFSLFWCATYILLRIGNHQFIISRSIIFSSHCSSWKLLSKKVNIDIFQITIIVLCTVKYIYQRINITYFCKRCFRLSCDLNWGHNPSGNHLEIVWPVFRLVANAECMALPETATLQDGVCNVYGCKLSFMNWLGLIGQTAKSIGALG